MAAHEIKTTIAVDGEQAFKRSLNDAKQSIRNLGTQLTLAQAEFKKTGDSQKLMETRAKTLKAEISAQEEIVKALAQAVDEAKDKFGEGSKQAESWEAELNRAKAAMANLQSELNNNDQGLDRNGKAFEDATASADDFRDAVNGIGKGVSFEMITSGIGSITTGFENAIKKAFQLGEEMWNMMREAASWADDEVTLAKVYGVSTDDLQRMQYAAKMVDTDVDTVIKSRQKLASAMGKELNSKDIQEAFQALRVPVYDNTTGKMRDLENVFWDVGAAIMALPDEVEQNNVAMKLFGKSWMELRPMFDSGRKAYEEAMDSATVIPEENLKRLNDLQDQLDKLDTEFQALKMNVLSELAPAFEVLAGALTDLMSEFNAYLQTEEGQKMMEDLRQALADFFDGVKNIDFKEAVDKVKGGLETIKGAFDWIVEHKGDVKSAIEGIGIAFAALKLSTLAINLGKIVTGFHNLFNLVGGKGGTPTVTGGGSGAVQGGGGLLVGAKNALTGAAAQGASVIASLGGLVPVMGDMFLNQTNAGRAVRDGGNIIEGVGKDIEEKTEEVKKNAETFQQDWENNNLLKPFIDLGKNNVKFWDNFWKEQQAASEYADQMEEIIPNVQQKSEPTDDWIFNDDWSAGELQAWVDAHSTKKNNDTIVLPSGFATSGVSGALFAGASLMPQTEKEPGLTSKDVQEFTKVPADMNRELRNALSGWNVKIDGRTAGAVLAPFINTELARDVR